MKRLRLAFARLILAALLAACGGGSPPAVRGQESNLLVATTGTVRLQRYGWKQYVPAGAGARLYPNDLLEVQGSAIVLCAGPDAKIMTDSGKPPCPEERGSFEYDGARFGGTQRGSLNPIPYILYPRKTLALDARPMLMWHATGAAYYDVTIVDSNGSVIWRQEQVPGNTIRYPDTAAALQPGVDYLLRVSDDNGRSSDDDPAKGLGFRVVSAEQRAAIEQQQQGLMAQASLDPAALQLALAVYYATWPTENGRSLWGDAALLLQQVAQTHNTPEIQLWLGDMFRATSLPEEAIAAYQDALQQAQASGNLAGQAAAEAGLWRVTGETDRRDAAIKLYQELGDQGEIDALGAAGAP